MKVTQDPQKENEAREEQMNVFQQRVKELDALIMLLKPKILRIKHEIIRKQYEDKISEIPEWCSHLLTILPSLKESALRQSYMKKVDELIAWVKTSNNGLSIQPEPKKNGVAKVQEDLEEKVNHSAHYNTGKYEVLDVIQDWKLNFSLGNVVKYVARAGKKDPNRYLEDLEKAKVYLNTEIDWYKNNEQTSNTNSKKR